jgi:hypothetical protein
MATGVAPQWLATTSRASVEESEAEQWRDGVREKEMGDKSLYWQRVNG